MNASAVVGPGMKVTLNFDLRFRDGTAIDSTGGRPASFIVGDGKLLPGFERLLFGMRAGESRELEVPPESGFGLPNAANVQEFPRSQFDRSVRLTEGLVMSFADGARGELAGVLTKVGDDVVVVDFNHPLAGETLIFAVEILAVDRVTNEIIRVSG